MSLHENTHSGCTYSCQSWSPLKVMSVVLSVSVVTSFSLEKFETIVLPECVKNNSSIPIGATLLRQ